MIAIRLTQIGRPLEAQDVPLPKLGDHDVLVAVQAAGICHSDAHYRAGTSPVAFTPITLGHEAAGSVAAIGARVTSVNVGDRVCVHYMATCGTCAYCAKGQEQFCTTGQMIGKHRDGGYAEYLALPARSVVPLPDEIPFEHGAIMMCSSATSYHALRKARLQPGETVAIYGVGGLGMSAIQLEEVARPEAAPGGLAAGQSWATRCPTSFASARLSSSMYCGNGVPRMLCRDARRR